MSLRSFTSGILCTGLLIYALASQSQAAEQPREMLRLNLASLPAAAENIACFGDIVAPKFGFSAFAATAFLAMTPPAMMMDVTKPLSIVFYEGQSEPGIGIAAYPRPNVKLHDKSSFQIGPWKMNLAPYQQNYLILHSQNFPLDISAAFIPPANQTATIELQAYPPILRKQFNLASLASGNARHIPEAADDFLASFRQLNLKIGMPERNRTMMELTGHLLPETSLKRYLKNSTPVDKVAAFSDAQELFVLNLPADKAFRNYFFKLLPLIRHTEAPQDLLRKSIVNGSNGRIYAAVTFSDKIAAEKYPLVKAVFELLPSALPSPANALNAFPETPFAGLRIIAREKTPDRENVLFARLENHSIVFYYCGMVQAELQMLLNTKTIPLQQNEPFAVYDLRSGEKILSLKGDGNSIVLHLDADNTFFQQFPPLIDQPITAMNFINDKATRKRKGNHNSSEKLFPRG